MKKKILIGVGIVIALLIVVGITTICLTKDNKVTENQTNQTNETYENNNVEKNETGVIQKELPAGTSIIIEYNGKNVEISNYEDANTIYKILVNLKYDSELCDGIITHQITIGNETYGLKKGCQEIQKGSKQSKVSNEDLKTILNIIEKNQ